MQDFQSLKEELENLKTEILSGIDKLRDSDEQEWNNLVTTLQSQFAELQNTFVEFNNAIPEFDQNDQDDARKYYAKMNLDIQALESRFNQIKKDGFQKKSTIAENFVDKEIPSNIPAPEQPTVQEPYNALEIEDVPAGQQIPDIEKPLNALEADVETNETGDTSIMGFCKRNTKYLLIAGCICIGIGIVCLIIVFIK